MTDLITYPLQVPNDPAAVVEVGEFQARLLRAYLGTGAGEISPGSDADESDDDDQGFPGYSWNATRYFGSHVDIDFGDDQGEETFPPETPEDAAKALYEKLSPNARRILGALLHAALDEGRESLTEQELAYRVELRPEQFRGSLSSFKVRARSLGRVNPVVFTRDPIAGGIYRLDDDAIDAFEPVVSEAEMNAAVKRGVLGALATFGVIAEPPADPAADDEG